MPCFDQSEEQLSERDLAAREYICALAIIEKYKIEGVLLAVINKLTNAISEKRAFFNFTKKELARAEVYFREESDQKERDEIQRRRKQQNKERRLLPAKWQKADLPYMPIKHL